MNDEFEEMMTNFIGFLMKYRDLFYLITFIILVIAILKLKKQLDYCDIYCYQTFKYGVIKC